MNKRAEKVFFYLHQPVFIIYCQIGSEFYTERSADRVEEQISIFHVLDDGVSSVSTIVFPEYNAMLGSSAIPVKTFNIPTVVSIITINKYQIRRSTNSRNHTC